MRKITLLTLAAFIFTMAAACSAVKIPLEENTTPQSNYGDKTDSEETQTVMDKTYQKQEGVGVIYLAGGCFWGIEKLAQSIPGVMEATSGYANGQAGNAPTYTTVSTGLTGYRETVRVEYDIDQVTLDAILFAYFHVIDPSIENAQGNDHGSQYQTGVYYADEESKEIVERIADIERERYERFVVEIEPLERFYDAEEYHQDYLDKNPNGYCHIPQEEFNAVNSMIVDPGYYPRPSEETIKSMLTDEQYIVTQQAGTEVPFQNEYWDNHERGIYVDVVTGEPLFSSSDKFDSGTGWPSFSDAVDTGAVILLVDNSHGMQRVEARSRAGNSHLGHVFYGEPISPTGVRYCINSASIKFIPYENMEVEGYGYLKEYIG